MDILTFLKDLKVDTLAEPYIELLDKFDKLVNSSN